MLSKNSIVVSIFLIATFGCEPGGFIEKSPGESILFTAIPANHSNIHFVNQVVQSDSFNCIRYTYALTGAGVAVGDVNNDGLMDIYLVANQGTNKLYLNRGDFKFEDLTITAKIDDSVGWSTGVTMIDINNDGWLDIYVCKSASLYNEEHRRNKLYINQKDGTFSEEAKSWGLDHKGFSMQSYFFDYDKDGDLDMYLLNHRIDFENTLRIEHRKNQKFIPETSDHLFRNDGQKFTQVTTQSKIINSAWGLSASIGDFNNDNWPDIYVANDYITPDFLYINKKDGTFSNQINTRFGHISNNSMGSDFADINNDFLPDLMVLEMSSEDHIRNKENMPSMNLEGFNKIVNAGYHFPYMTNVLQLNNGNGSFSDIGQLAGVSKTDWSWAPLLADFDNDGFKDLFVTNGILRNFSNQDYIRKVKHNLDLKISMTIKDVIEMMPADTISNYCFKNEGDLTFKNASSKWGINENANSNGVAYADFDNDGDLDLILNNHSQPASLYRNNATGNFLNIKLVGDKKNRNGIGAKIKVKTVKNAQFQQLYTSRGYLSSVSNVINFGIAKEENVEAIEVLWPNGKISYLEDISANQSLTIKESKALLMKPKKTGVNRKFVRENPKNIGIQYTHDENTFNDFKEQVLLPQKYSQSGPVLAVADVNGDGLQDFFAGGAKDQVAAIYVQNKSGRFEILPQRAMQNDSSYEDVGVQFFDADNDKDLDLYVCSGGYEFPENSPYLADRLYINDGEGNFSKGLIPTMRSNTKSVATADVDADGDMDLVVGGHVKPRKYPLASPTTIFKNEEGIFSESTALIAPELSQVGIVNDLLFSDYDNDGDSDLFVVGEWIPITLFQNNNGHFEIKTVPQFEHSNGWWQCIESIDIDHDGDQDYVVGNLGKNNKFNPSPAHPLHIFSGEFDNNTSYDLVLSKSYEGRLVPLRGKECSTAQNKFISQKIKTYGEFARSSLQDIYGDIPLQNAYHKQVYQLASMLIENKGNGKFELVELPNEAQKGPTLSFAFTDINGDGKDDVIGVGAIHETEVETVRYDANVGYILLTAANGGLTPYKDYNFFNNRNAKAIKKIAVGHLEYLLIGNNDGPLTVFKTH